MALKNCKVDSPSPIWSLSVAVLLSFKKVCKQELHDGMTYIPLLICSRSVLHLLAASGKMLSRKTESSSCKEHRDREREFIWPDFSTLLESFLGNCHHPSLGCCNLVFLASASASLMIFCSLLQYQYRSL